MYFCVRGACLSCMELGWAPWAWRAGREQERWEQILQRQSAAPMPRRPLWPAHACAPHLLPPAHAYMYVSALSSQMWHWPLVKSHDKPFWEWN